MWWSVCIRKLCQPRTEADGKPVTESNLSLRAFAQVAAGMLGNLVVEAAVRCRAESCDLCAATRIYIGRATPGSAGEEWAICGVAWHCRTPLLLWWRQEVSP
jgi:hypothetical protein